MDKLRRWWPGQTRWRVLFDNADSVAQTAVTELQRCVQTQLPYVLEVMPTGEGIPSDRHDILLATSQAPRIRALASRGLVEVPVVAGGYFVGLLDSPWNDGKKLIVVTGHDSAGMLYGVEELRRRINAFASPLAAMPRDQLDAFDNWTPFSITDYPRIQDRGIWTWGYVIYDYRRFLDQMMRMRMNMLTIWNDVVPLNARQITEYAHARGIRVIWGFHWGWITNQQTQMLARIAEPTGRAAITADILQRFRAQYAPLNPDGIYFQTATEHNETTFQGRPVIEIIVEFVNEVAGTLLQEYPGLPIQFGLHAISVKEGLEPLKRLDPRVTITWEDAGTTPFSYDPSGSETELAGWRNTWEQTLDYSRKLAVLRPDTPFAMVPKGWSCIDWANEFENHGPFILGERDPAYVAARAAIRRNRWATITPMWQAVYGQAAQFYREIHDIKPASMLVTGLLEDGCIEDSLPAPVRAFGDMIWNPYRDDRIWLAAETTLQE